MKDRKFVCFLSFSFIKQQKLGLLLLCTQSPAINHARNRKHSSKRPFNFLKGRFSGDEKAKEFLP